MTTLDAGVGILNSVVASALRIPTIVPLSPHLQYFIYCYYSQLAAYVESKLSLGTSLKN